MLNFEGARVLVTGHTGFKGSWLITILQSLGAKVKGISIQEQDQRIFSKIQIKEICEHCELDIRDYSNFEREVVNFEPDFIFHFAAQSLVLPGYKAPKETFETNFNGTLNLLEIIRVNRLTANVVITTTDKVYENKSTGRAFVETDILGGEDPYSASKTAKEFLIRSYFNSFLKDIGSKVGVARAGNVIGGGDWNIDRLIPDAIRAIEKGEKLEIRNPLSTRPWQHVIEPIMGYLKFAKYLNARDLGELAIINFGPKSEAQYSVSDVLSEMKTHFPNLRVDVGSSHYREAHKLMLCSKKSENLLGMQPNLPLDLTIKMTCDWYKNQMRGVDPKNLILADWQRYLEFIDGK